MNMLTEEALNRARDHINRGTSDAYDCADSHGQNFENVRHMTWFLYALAGWLDNNQNAA